MGFIEADILCKSTTSSVINGAITGGVEHAGIPSLLSKEQISNAVIGIIEQTCLPLELCAPEVVKQGNHVSSLF